MIAGIVFVGPVTVAGTPGIFYSELARRARVTVQRMHATVGALTDLGAVVGGRDGRGRSAVLQITEPGRSLLASVRTTIGEVDDELRASAIDPDGLAEQLAAVLALGGGPATS